jgi:hypothetical protein
MGRRHESNRLRHLALLDALGKGSSSILAQIESALADLRPS